MSFCQKIIRQPHVLGTKSRCLRLNSTNSSPESRYRANDKLKQSLNQTHVEGEKAKEDQNESHDHEDSQAFRQKMELIERLKAMGVGIGILLLAGGGIYAYNNRNYLKYTVFHEHDLSKFDESFKQIQEKKEKATEKMLEETYHVTNPYDSSVPGLYLTGSNSSGIMDPSNPKLKRQLVFKRLGFFDGKMLRSVTLGEHSAAAVDERGDVYQWGKGFTPSAQPALRLKNQNVEKVEISNGVLYCLCGNGKVIYFPEKSKVKVEGKEARLFGLWQRKTNYLALETPFKVSDIASGKQHLVLLSQSGQVFTCATGLKRAHESLGQFGLTDFTQFDKPPLPNKVHEIIFLNKYKGTDKSGKESVVHRKFDKVAAGDFHSLALDNAGGLWSFGLNRYGAVGKPVTYNSEIIPFPSKMDSFGAYFNKTELPRCIDMASAGGTCFATFTSSDVYELFKKSWEQAGNASFDVKKLAKDTKNLFLFSWGYGLKGELGVGHYMHGVADPQPLRHLMDMKDYNEKTNRMESIGVRKWCCGNNHIFVVLNNDDVLCWGDNEFGQLGNGKRIRSAGPQLVHHLLEPNSETEKKTLTSRINDRLALSHGDLKDVRGRKIKSKVELQMEAGENASALYYNKK